MNECSDRGPGTSGPMFFGSICVWKLARQAWERTLAVPQDSLSPAADALSAILLSSASAEGMVNEAAQACLQSHPSLVTPRMLDFGREILANEKARTREKYKLAWNALGGELKTDEPIHEEFRLLFEVRNLLMHLKGHRINQDSQGPAKAGNHIDEASAAALDAIQHGIHQTIRQLEKKKLLLRNRTGLPFYHRVQTSSAAAWACNSSLAMMNGLLNLAPDNGGPLQLLKDQIKLQKRCEAES